MFHAMNKAAFVYIMANFKRGTLYTGMSSGLPGRVHLHKTGPVHSFTRQYGCKLLVYFEPHDDIREAIRREKQIKRWRRQWKIELIESQNPDWRDLYGDLF